MARARAGRCHVGAGGWAGRRTAGGTAVAGTPATHTEPRASAWTDVNPYGFFGSWLSCNGAADHGWFCDARIDRELRRATVLEATLPRTATRLWSRIDHELTDRAVMVPFANESATNFVSRRVSNAQQNPFLGLIVDQIRLQPDNTR